MIDLISWIATVATIAGALATASNLGARITGIGFAIFLVGSLAWLADGILTDQPALVWTNIVLTILNLFGMWRWLGRQAKVEQGGRKAAERSRAAPGDDLFPLSWLTRAPALIGGEKAGHCVDAMAESGSGQIRYLVVSDGGVAGVGEALRRVDWNRARVADGSISLDVARLDDLEPVERDRWPAR